MIALHGCASRYTGKERDSESGKDYFGARYYASSMGRFMSPDPGNAGADITNPQSWNMYSYVLNNPLTNIDPTGMSSQTNGEDCNDDTHPGDCLATEGMNGGLLGDDGVGQQLPPCTIDTSGNCLGQFPGRGTPLNEIPLDPWGGSCSMDDPMCQLAFPQLQQQLMGLINTARNAIQSCAGQAIIKGAASAGIDAIGLLPEGGVVSAAFSGFRGAAGVSNGTKVLQSVKMGVGIIGTASSASSTSGGNSSSSKAVAGFQAGVGVLGIAKTLGAPIPVAGQFLAGVSIITDFVGAGIEVAHCH